MWPLIWSILKTELKIRKVNIKYKNPHLTYDDLNLPKKSKMRKIDKTRKIIKNG